MTVKELIDLLDCVPWDSDVFIKTSSNTTEIIDALILNTRTDTIDIKSIEAEEN